MTFDRHPGAWSRDLPGNPRRNQGPHGATRTTLNKTRPQPGDGVSAFLCNFLDDHGVKPVEVLKKAGLRHETQADWHHYHYYQRLCGTRIVHGLSAFHDPNTSY
jgi:hypothetical protein